MTEIEIMCFPHSDDQFETPAELMDFLNNDLKYSHKGYYRYRTSPAPGNLAPGSIVLFYKNDFIVGSAVVEKSGRALTDSEMKDCEKIYSEENCGGMKHIIKFIPESIWVFGEHELVSADKFKEITKKNLKMYVTIQAEDLLKIYGEVAAKRTEIDDSFN